MIKEQCYSIYEPYLSYTTLLRGILELHQCIEILQISALLSWLIPQYGKRGIRTHVGLSPKPVFKTGTINQLGHLSIFPYEG